MQTTTNRFDDIISNDLSWIGMCACGAGCIWKIGVCVYVFPTVPNAKMRIARSR